MKPPERTAERSEGTGVGAPDFRCEHKASDGHSHREPPGKHRSTKAAKRAESRRTGDTCGEWGWSGSRQTPHTIEEGGR
ncbi:MAG: hypothetical protein DCC49_09255 [Acidobacteria bacterium]|nr:MAG: hypothetical protein DCC49_09255 [Acidobacteriota bacterium]